MIFNQGRLDMKQKSAFAVDRITVLIQGNFSDQTVQVIKRIRAQAPQAPIVVSCWESNRDLVSRECFDYVTTIFSSDPGAHSIPGFKVDNIRRQIISTRAGLAQVHTPWVVKIRSDVMIDFLKISELTMLCVPVQDPAVALFKHKVVATSLTTLKGTRSGFYFHVCDWIYLGRTEDIAAIFSAPVPEGDFFTYFQHANPAPEICSRYRSESYLVYHLVRNKLGINYHFSGYLDTTLAALSLKVLKTNFAIVNYWNLGLRCSKHKKLYLFLRPDCYAELTCGAFISSVGPLRAAVSISREIGCRLASALVQQLVKWRDR